MRGVVILVIYQAQLIVMVVSGVTNRMGFYPYHFRPTVLETGNNRGSTRKVTDWVKELLLEDPERSVKQKQDTSKGGGSWNSYI